MIVVHKEKKVFLFFRSASSMLLCVEAKFLSDPRILTFCKTDYNYITYTTFVNKNDQVYILILWNIFSECVNHLVIRFLKVIRDLQVFAVLAIYLVNIFVVKLINV